MTFQFEIICVCVFSFDNKLTVASEFRLNWILGLHHLISPNVGKSQVDMREISLYGMGTKRLIDDYWKFVGFNKTNSSTVDVCDDLKAEKFVRIPWNEGVDPFDLVHKNT